VLTRGYARDAAARWNKSTGEVSAWNLIRLQKQRNDYGLGAAAGMRCRQAWRKLLVRDQPYEGMLVLLSQ
jgi:hypothetical protein